MVLATESEGYQSIADHRHNQRDAAEMKCGLGQNRFTSEQRLGNPGRHIHGPGVMPVISVGECDEKAGIGDAFHVRENPLRFDRFFGPRTLPAKRIKACLALLVLAFSN